MQNEHVGSPIGERDDLRVIDCKTCGYAHLETMPNTDDLNRFYASDFWTKEKPDALARIDEQREWWAAIYGDWFELIERHTPNRTLLDVGAGYGHFMREAQTRKWRAHGIEPSREAVKYAPSDTFYGTWKNLRTWIRYACLSALWLIEHLPDPLHFLRWAHDRLSLGGVLLAVVPNDFSPIQLRANHGVENPFWFVDKTHLSYFTPESFANMVGRAGFRIVERSTLHPVERFLLNGEDYTNNSALGAKLYDSVTQYDLELTRPERMARYQDLARRGEGRELVVVAVRE